MDEKAEDLKKELDELFQKMLSLRNAKYLVKFKEFFDVDKDFVSFLDGNNEDELYDMYYEKLEDAEDEARAAGWEEYEYELNGKKVTVTYKPRLYV